MSTAASSAPPIPTPIGTGPDQATPSAELNAQTDSSGSSASASRPATTNSAPSCGRRRIVGRPARPSSASVAERAHARAPRGSAQ